jgi:CRP-like cAMP-binding protein
MYITQSDLFHGMNSDFIKEVMGLAEKESYEAGTFLFRKGDAADHFYILLKGQLDLSPGDPGEVIHAVTHAGEAFGWSSLVGRGVYSASARCLIETRLLKFNGVKLQRLMTEDPGNGLIFYRKLADALGQRLIQTYKMVSSSAQAQSSVSFGTGSMIEAEMT